MKRIAAMMAGLAGAVLLAAGIMMKVKSQREVSVIGETMVIGGADGPTSIFIAARVNYDALALLLIAEKGIQESADYNFMEVSSCGKINI